MPKTRTQILLSPEALAALKTLAEAEGLSKSSWLEMMIRKLFNKTKK